MNKEVSIIYASSNKELPEFEQRIRDNIIEHCGDIPIISVTQKPIDFGTNICVGEDVGVSGFNFFRQSLIACQAAKTRFVLSCEADTLYPPDYFQWVPDRDDKCYRNDNVYVMGQHRKYFFKKPGGATHGQIVNREFYIKTLEKWFEGEPKWDATQFNFPKEKSRMKCEDVFWKTEIEYYHTENPVIQIKTSQSMRNYTSAIREPIYELPFWGSGKDFRAKFYNIIKDGIKIIH